MKPGDNTKKPYLNLFISGIGKGSNNAVNALESVYRKWELKQHANNTKSI